MTMPLSNIPLKEEVSTVSDELELYFQNKFNAAETQISSSFKDEPYIKSWENYCVASENAFELLKRCYPQLNFSIEEGINKSQHYNDAVLKGKKGDFLLQNNLKLNNPEGIKISVFESIAGKVPVLKVPDSQDFIKFVQALLHKNNPVPVPASMGALLVNGINNWDRLNALKNDWIINNPGGNWNEEFLKNVLPNPSLFKDKIIILSTKPYSNVSADSLKIPATAWKIYSYSIRLEHECTHLYTLKKYGYASNNLHDELVADYIGITKTIGYYNKDWMLTFMGLEKYPIYRKGARLENYLGNSNLSFENFDRLTIIIKNAIENICIFDKKLGEIRSDTDQMCRTSTLCEVDVLDIASPDGADLLFKKYERISAKMTLIFKDEFL